MTKKTSQKKKVTLKIAAGQAAFVADLSVLEHMMKTYVALGDSEHEHEYKDYWYNIAKDIREWIKETYNPLEESFDDEETW
jgi:hypothetical protein